MLPIKMDLTEKVAATLRKLRLEYPVNGEILTAEKLSKAIGNNRAWMSQIESRRLKKIKREDIIKIYKLLHNVKDDTKLNKLQKQIYVHLLKQDMIQIKEVVILLMIRFQKELFLLIILYRN